jgi:acyl-CoA thioester hydrolase
MKMTVPDRTAPAEQWGEVRLRVRYAETDQMGVVYHANYLVWMEMGRVEYFRSAGFRYRDMEEEGILLAVVGAECRYLAPARYDDEILVRTRVAESASRMVRFAYEIRHGESGMLLAEGSTRHLFCDRSMHPVRLPEKYRSAFEVAGKSR